MPKPRYSGQFQKDVKKRKNSGCKDIEKLKAVLRKLADSTSLESKYRDHPLMGSLKGYRDCHIEPDWLLIYCIDDKGEITFVRTGSHSDLFG